MNAVLAQLYGTAKAAETEETEKIAAVELLTKVAEEEGYDLSQLSEEDIEALVATVLAQGEGEGEGEGSEEEEKKEKKKEEEGGDPEEGEEKTAAAAIEAAQAEGDLIGRVVAHACFDELEKLAAQAIITEAAKEEGVEKEAGPKTEALKKFLTLKGMRGTYGKSQAVKVAPGKSTSKLKSMLAAMKKHKGEAAYAGGGLAALLGGGAAAAKAAMGGKE